MPEDATGDIRYRLELAGLETTGLAGRFRDLSVLAKSESEDSNLAQINRRIREDVELLERLLRAEGYYAGHVTGEVRPPDQPGGRTLIRLQAEPGPRYLFDEIMIDTPAGTPREIVLAALGIDVGSPVSATMVQVAEQRVLQILPEKGYPFVAIAPHRIIVDHATRAASYAVTIDSGPPARFGGIRLEGPRLFGPRHLARLARFQAGDRFDARAVEDFRRALVATGLFGAVSIRPERAGEAPDGVVTVNLVVTTEAAPLRTIAASVGYGTGEGVRVEGSWQHRNLIRPEGAVTLRGVVGTREQRLAGEFRRSNLRKRDRTLLLAAEIAHQDQDAFEARSLTLGGRIERETNLIWQKRWFWSVGAELVASSERDRDINRNVIRQRTFFIAAAPASLSYDGTDDLLDPTRGFRLAFRLSPETSLQSGAFSYLKGQVEGSGYYPLSDKLVLAGRARAGSIVGASRDRIAPSRRFYAGGGGSVRGFGYQDIGPKDAEGDPIGGRSLAEVAAELRFRAFGDLGIVPFIDGGQLYTTTLPRLESFRFGAGIGVRYYTSFGPIRVDVATPLARERGEPKVAVYVSIGQAF